MNVEKEQRKIHTGSIILMIIALIMIYISITRGILPPGLTGAGFLILVWMKEEKEAIERSLVNKINALDNDETKDKKQD
ncbi:MAG: hypothetical protein MRY57_04170 [Candidatus Pacebacteria bacterium]|nr:hypothetical protein [Candidatus Paceibacterota bacterium]